MKKAILILMVLLLLVTFASCGPRDYILNEKTFFLVMTNMQYYPEQYLNSRVEFDCFIYELFDVDGTLYICGVRKCSSGYGCTCGKDTIIGFVLESEEELPKATNQSEDTNEKTWVHLSGKIKSADKTNIEIHSYLPDGSVDPSKTEQITFLVFVVESCDTIEDYSNLHYYVTE